MHSLHTPNRPVELRSLRARRSALLVGVSSVAATAMLMVAPQSANAQVAATGRAFEADPSSVLGSVTFTRSDTQDLVRINSAEAVITWDPVDTATGGGPINILPQNNTLAFAGDTPFIVLNRVIPTDQSRAIQFNGNVVSTVGGAVGGNVWFYSPGGIIAGPTARFVVGSLVLSSSELTGIDKNGTELNFLGARANSAIDIQPGAVIATGDYVVLWSPRIQQGGTIISGVQAGGNVSLVGAESGILTVTGGLFDMTVNVGTDDPNGVVHTGTTTGQTPVDGVTRAITLATVAKNDFVNMLVGGNVGYADASAANISNGIVRLTAGSGVQPASGNITINPATFNSTTIAQASGDLTIALSGIGNNLSIGSATNDADFIGVAADQLSISAVNGASILAFDDFAIGAAVPGQGGTVSIVVDDAGRNDDSSFSGLIVGGNLVMSVFGNGVDGVPDPFAVAAGPTVGGNGVGGTIDIDVSQGGELLVGGATTILAGATGGFGTLRSGSATGGNLTFDVSGNNTRIIFAGDLNIDASANRSSAAPVNSGTFVTAGNIDLNFASGALSFNNLNLTSNADADDSITASGRANGAQAGSISLTNGARLSGAAVNINAQGLGANAGSSIAASDAGGAGQGGTVLVQNLAGGSLTLTSLGINANGSGGAGGNGSDLVAGGRGGIGSGGSITFSNAGTLTGNPVVTLSATGTGGAGGAGGATPNDFDPAADGGDAGAGLGGAINLIADGAAASVQVGPTINASGTGGTGGTGGTAPFFIPGDGGLGGAGVGGDIALRSINGGALTLATTTGTTTLDASAGGGIGGDGGTGLSVLGDPGANGSTTGGTVEVAAVASTLSVTGNLIADASAYGNQDLRTGATGADATAGTITVSAQTAGALTISGGLWLNASALAAIGELSAGTGRGGTANLLMSGTGTTFDIQGQFPAFFANPPRGRSLFVDTSAYEPQSGAPFLTTASGGNTFGGAINLAFTGGNSTINGTTDLRSFSAVLNPLSSSGGAPDQFVDGATATGGTIAIALANGTHTWGTLNGSIATFGFGGSAINGSIRASLDNATLNLVTTPGGVGSLGLDTYVGGETAQSVADAVVLRLINGSTLTAEGGISLFADAGHGISGNPITTGNVLVELDNSDLTVGTGNIFLGNEAQAFRFPATATNTTGADALAGNITIRAVNGSTIDGDVQFSSFALADAGASGGDARSGNLSYLLDGSNHTGNISMLSFAEGQGAGDVSGTGGTSTGGDQSIILANGADYTGDIDLETSLYTYHAGPAQGAYGALTGSAAALNVTDSVANIGVINAQFNGGADPAANNFAGADISAGSMTISAVGSTLSIGDASISLDAIGGVGGQGARGGNGSGGTIVVTSDVTSSLTLNDVVFSADGNGGAAGAAAPEEDGPDGGTGTGGRISITTLGDVTINSMFADATGRGGDGGAGVSGQLGGIGGTGQGGTAELEFSAAPTVTTVLGSISLDSSATGGTGGTGGGGNISQAATGGGSGGAALAGTTRLRVTGNGAVIAFDPAVFGLASAATGGVGGRGGTNFNGGVAGRGGDGGAGTGGRIALEAGSGATLTLDGPSGSTFIFQVTGTGGAGGAGGNIDMINGGTAGDGGNGGDGTGGSPTLRAVGGRIIAPDIHLLATGIGGAGGIGGDEGTVVLGATGNGGLGRGGTPLLQTLDGSPGVLTLGTVLIDASGIGGGGTITGSTAGGQITITDASADPAGLITMGSLTVTALGAATASGTPSLTVSGDSGPITVTGPVNADVGGSINFAFSGNGQFDVGGAATLNAAGNISVAHSGNMAGVTTLDIGTDLIATAGGNFVAGIGSIISAGRDVSITAQNIQFASVSALRDLLLVANNGNINGVGQALLQSGRLTDLEASQAISIGNIASDRSIELTAGTDITTGNLTGVGVATIFDERINIVAGGNVTLGVVDAIDALTISGVGLTATSLDGQSVTATMTGAIDVGVASSATTIGLTGTTIALDNGDAPGNIVLNATAGGMTLGTINSETDLLATATGNIAFTNLTGRVVTLDAGGTITGGTAAADRAVTSGVPRNVNLTATGAIAITGASAVDSVVARGASFTATQVTSGTNLNDAIDVVVSGLIDIDTTRSGGQTVLNGSAVTLGTGVAGSGTSVITSTTGAVDIGSFDSENFLDIVSATTADFGTLTARAMSITATGNVTGTRAATDVNLTSGRLRDVTIETLGAVSVDQLSAIASVNVNASSVTATTIEVGSAGFGGGNTGGRIVINVTGLAAVDTLSARGVGANGAITISANTIELGDATANGAVLLTSTAGNIEFGTIDTEDFFDADSASNIVFDTATGLLVEFTANGNISGTRAAADVNLTSGRPRNVTLDAVGAVSIGTVGSIGNVLLDGSSVDAGIVIAAGTGTFTATGLVAVDTLDSGGSTTINAGSADIGVANTRLFTGTTTGQFDLDSLTTSGGGADAFVTAGGAINLGSITSSRIARLNGASINGGTVIAAAALDLDGGSVNLARAQAGNGFITIDTITGGVSVNELVATTFGIIVDSAGSFASNSINAGGSFQLDAVTNAALGVVNAGDAISATAGGNITAGDLFAGTNSPGVTLRAGGAATLADVTTNGLIDIVAGGALTGGDFSSRGQITLRAASIDITSAVSSLVGGAFLTSTSGNVSADLLQTNGGAIEVVSAGEIDLAELTTAGAIRLTSAGNASLGTANSGGQMALTIGGDLVAGNLSGASPSTIGIIIDVAGDARLASVNSGGLLDIDVDGALTGTNLTSFSPLTVDAASIELADVHATGSSVAITSTAGNVLLGNVTGGIGSVTINSAGALNAAALEAANAVRVTTALDAVMTTVDAGGQVQFTIGGSLTAGDIAGASPSTIGVQLGVGGNAVLGAVRSGGLLDVDVVGSLTGTNFSGFGPVTIDAGSIALANVGSDLFGVALRTTSGAITTTGITAPGTILVNSAGAATLGVLDTDIGIDVTAGGNTSITSANAVTGVVLMIAGDLNSGALTSRGPITVDAASIELASASTQNLGNILLTSTLGDITVGEVTSSLTLTVDSAAAATLGNLTTIGPMSLTSVGDMTLGNAESGAALTIDAGSNLTALDLVAGTTNQAANLTAGGNASITSLTSNNITNIDVGGAFAADALVSRGRIVADAGSMVIGTLEQTGTGANSSLTSTIGSITVGTVDSALGFAATSADALSLGAVTAVGRVDLASAGDMTLADLTAGAVLTIDAGGNLGTGALASGTTNQVVTVDVAGDADIASLLSANGLAIDVGGALTGGAFQGAAPTINAGSIDIASFASTFLNATAVAATGDAVIGAASAALSVIVSALDGDAILGSTASGLDTVITGRNVGLDSGTVGRTLRLNATSGNIAGTGAITVGGAIDLDASGDIGFGTLAAQGGSFTADAGGAIGFDAASAVGAITFVAGGNVAGGNLTSPGTVAVTGARVVLGDVIAGAVSLTSGSDILFDLIRSANPVTLTASNGMIGAHTGAGDIESDGDVALLAQSIALRNVTSGGSIGATTTVGDVSFEALDAVNAITVFAAGTASVTSSGSGGNTSITGASVSLANGLVSGDLRLLATAGDLVATGPITVGGAIDLDASGDIGFGTLAAQGGAFTADAGGDIAFTAASSSDRIAITAGGEILGGNLAAPNAVQLSAGRIAIGNVAAGSIGLTSGSDILFDRLQSDTALTLVAASGVIGANTGAGDITSDGDISLTARSIAIGDAVSAGSISATATVGDASFGALEAASAITVSAAGTPSFASLASGDDTSITGAGINLNGGTISGNLSLDATGGDIVLALDGSNQIAVGGNTSLNASGDILLTHTNNTGGTVSLDSTGNILAFAGGAIRTAAGSILSGNEVFLLSGGQVDLWDVRAVPALIVTAGGSVDVHNATVAGPQGVSNVAGVRINAGQSPFGSSPYDNFANVRITGTVQSYSGIEINTGGTASFAAGSQTLAGDRIVVRTGDDIVIEAGALLQSARDAGVAIDPADPFGSAGSIDLHAGGLTFLLSTPQTPIASLVVDGTINAGRGAVLARAKAIDGLDGSFAGSSLSFDIDDAPPSGSLLSDDNGLLTAPCLEGRVCLGSIAASNVLAIGQSSNNDVLALLVEQGTVNAREIRITTRDDIVMGTNGIATTLNASDLFSAVSRTGDVDLRDAVISSDQILIDAAGSLLGGASLTSANDIGITVGDSLTAASIATGGELTTVADVGGAPEGFYSVPGSITVGSLSVGAGNIDYSAGGSIDLGSVTVPSSDIRLSAGGAINLGSTNGAANIGLFGGSVSAGSLDAGGLIEIESGSDVSLGSANAGGELRITLPGELQFSSLSAGTIDASAGGAINGGDLSGGTVRLSGGSIAIGDADAAELDFTSQSDIRFNVLQSTGAIALRAANGVIANNGGAGDVTSGGNVTLLARTLDLGSVRSGATLDARATAGDALIVTVSAVTDARVSATGNVTLGTFSAGRDGDAQADSDSNGSGNLTIAGAAQAVRNLNLYGANVSLADVSVTGVAPAPTNRLSGFVTINSTNGSVIVGNVTAPGMTIVSEGGSLTSGALRAFDPVIVAGLPTVIDLSAFGGNITVASLDSVGDVTVFTEGSTLTRVLGSSTAGNDIVFSGSGSFAFDGLVTAGRDVIGRATGPANADIALGAGAAVGRNLDLVAANGAIRLLPPVSGPNTVGGNLTFTAREIGLSAVNVGGNLSLTATAGNLDASQVGTVGGSIALGASADVLFGALTAGSGDFTVTAGNNISFDSAQASGAIRMNGARIAGGDASAGGLIALTAGQDIVLGQVSAGSDVTATAGGAFTAEQVSASQSGTGLVDIAAVNGISLSTLVGNTARLAASGGAISVSVDINMRGLVDATGQSVLLRSTHDLAATASASVGNIDIETTDDLDVRSAAAAAGDVRLASTGGVATVANVSADAVSSGRGGNVELTADENLNIAGPVTAAANLATRSGERTSIRAAAVGRDIDLSASDLAIDSTGSLGNFAATRSIEISGGSIARVGGAAGGDPAFVIDNSEFARIQSGGTIAISASTALILDDLDIAVAAGTGSQGNLRGDGRIDFSAAEGIEVVGEVAMSGATGDNAIGLRTAGDVFLDASSGLLEISDAGGAFLGTIEVEASNFYALTEQALTDVEAATTITQIDERLAQNDGIDNPDGLIRTGTLDIMTVTSDVFIQNTAPGTAFAERRGFTVDELLISDPAGTNQPIVINGIIDGQTGVDAVSLAQISSAFDPGSTINGCLIANVASCTVIPSHSEQSSPPVQDLIEGQLDEGSSEAGETITAGLLDTPLFELKDPANTSEDPLLDDPVTGAGNEDLWVGECEGEAAENGLCTVPAE